MSLDVPSPGGCSHGSTPTLPGSGYPDREEQQHGHWWLQLEVPTRLVLLGGSKYPCRRTSMMTGGCECGMVDRRRILPGGRVTDSHSGHVIALAPGQSRVEERQDITSPVWWLSFIILVAHTHTHFLSLFPHPLTIITRSSSHRLFSRLLLLGETYSCYPRALLFLLPPPVVVTRSVPGPATPSIPRSPVTALRSWSASTPWPSALTSAISRPTSSSSGSWRWASRSSYSTCCAGIQTPGLARDEHT